MSARLLALALALMTAGCAKQQEVILETPGRRATAEQIDADPWALLPGGAVVWADLDATKLFSSAFADEARTLVLDSLPLARGVGIEPARDLTRLCSGMYANVGADVAVIVRGKFRPLELKQRIEREPVARHNRPIKRNTFAGFDVYVMEQLAMAPLTEQTLVFGTETGVRRVLERIEAGRLKRALPSWYEEMLRSGAPITLGVNLDAQPVPATVRTRLSFLDGLRAGRLLGNFEEPGVNIAGTLTYDRPDSATNAEAGIKSQAASLDRFALLLSVLHVPRPLRRVDARAVGKDTQVVVEIEGRAIAALLARSSGDLPINLAE